MTSHLYFLLTNNSTEVYFVKSDKILGRIVSKSQGKYTIEYDAEFEKTLKKHTKDYAKKEFAFIDESIELLVDACVGDGLELVSYKYIDKQKNSVEIEKVLLYCNGIPLAEARHHKTGWEIKTFDTKNEQSFILSSPMTPEEVADYLYNEFKGFSWGVYEIGF